MTRLLTLTCGLLAVVVAAEVANRPGIEVHAGQTGPASARQPAPEASRPSAQVEPAIGQWMAVALARPLFAPDRKPVAGTVASDPGMPRLTGIIASPDGAVAIFQPAGDAKPLVARHGEGVGGWEVTSIAADSVGLRKQNEVIVLSPSFAGSQHGGGSAQQVKAPKSRWEEAAPKGLERARWSNPQLQP